MAKINKNKWISNSFFYDFSMNENENKKQKLFKKNFIQKCIHIGFLTRMFHNISLWFWQKHCINMYINIPKTCLISDWRIGRIGLFLAISSAALHIFVCSVISWIVSVPNSCRKNCTGFEQFSKFFGLSMLIGSSWRVRSPGTQVHF